MYLTNVLLGQVNLRSRLQVPAYRAKAGVYGGFAYGLRNYRSGWVGGVNECSAERIRFGLLYRIR